MTSTMTSYGVGEFVADARRIMEAAGGIAERRAGARPLDPRTGVGPQAPAAPHLRRRGADLRGGRGRQHGALKVRGPWGVGRGAKGDERLMRPSPLAHHLSPHGPRPTAHVRRPRSTR